MFPLKSDLGLKRRGRQHGVKNDSQSLPSPYRAVVGAAPAAPLHPVLVLPTHPSPAGHPQPGTVTVPMGQESSEGRPFCFCIKS